MSGEDDPADKTLETLQSFQTNLPIIKKVIIEDDSKNIDTAGPSTAIEVTGAGHEVFVKKLKRKHSNESDALLDVEKPKRMEHASYENKEITNQCNKILSTEPFVKHESFESDAINTEAEKNQNKERFPRTKFTPCRGDKRSTVQMDSIQEEISAPGEPQNDLQCVNRHSSPLFPITYSYEPPVISDESLLSRLTTEELFKAVENVALVMESGLYLNLPIQYMNAEYLPKTNYFDKELCDLRLLYRDVSRTILPHVKDEAFIDSFIHLAQRVINHRGTKASTIQVRNTVWRILQWVVLADKKKPVRPSTAVSNQQYTVTNPQQGQLSIETNFKTITYSENQMEKPATTPPVTQIQINNNQPFADNQTISRNETVNSNFCHAGPLQYSHQRGATFQMINDSRQLSLTKDSADSHSTVNEINSGRTAMISKPDVDSPTTHSSTAPSTSQTALGSPNVTYASPQPCHVCGTVTRLRCKDCQKSYYCSANCQVSDWSLHESICQAL